MQVNFETNKNYNPYFGNYEMTKEATKLLRNRVPEKYMPRVLAVLENFDLKGSLINGKLDVIDGYLVASIHSVNKYSESKTEGWVSHLIKRNPTRFIEKWAKRADQAEIIVKNKIKLEEIADTYKENIPKEAFIHLGTRFMTADDLERLEKLLQTRKENEHFVKLRFNEVNGDLTALIWSDGRYSEELTESGFRRLFRSPIHFIEDCVNKAEKVEAKISKDIEFEKHIK